MPKFDVKIELHGRYFFYKDIPAETMDDACAKAKTRAERSLKVVSVATSPAVRPDVRESNAKQIPMTDPEAFYRETFGKKR